MMVEVGGEDGVVVVSDSKRLLSSSREADPLFATRQHLDGNGKRFTSMGRPSTEDSFEDSRSCYSVPTFQGGLNSPTVIYHPLSKADRGREGQHSESAFTLILEVLERGALKLPGPSSYES